MGKVKVGLEIRMSEVSGKKELDCGSDLKFECRFGVVRCGNATADARLISTAVFMMQIRNGKGHSRGGVGPQDAIGVGTGGEGKSDAGSVRGAQFSNILFQIRIQMQIRRAGTAAGSIEVRRESAGARGCGRSCSCSVSLARQIVFGGWGIAGGARAIVRSGDGEPEALERIRAREAARKGSRSP